MQYFSLIVKKFIVIVLCICILFSVSPGVFADGFGGSGFGSTSYSTVSIYDYIQGFLNRSAELGDDLIEDVSVWWSDITDADYYNSSVDSLANTFGGRYAIANSDTGFYFVGRSNSYSLISSYNYVTSTFNYSSYSVAFKLYTNTSYTGSNYFGVKSLSYYSNTFSPGYDGTYNFIYPSITITGTNYIYSSNNSYIYYYVQCSTDGGSSWSDINTSYRSYSAYSTYESIGNGLYNVYMPSVSTSVKLNSSYLYRIWVLYTYLNTPSVSAYAYDGYTITAGFNSLPYCYYASSSSAIIPSYTRLASVNNYSSYYNTYINNNYTSGDTIYNYYIGTLNSNDEVNNVYDSDIYDEETLIFTEPVTGDQIQTSGWKYLYTSAARSYYLTLSDGTYYYQASEDDDVQEITNIMLAYLDDCLYICGFTQDIGEYSTAIEALAGAAFIDQYYYVIAETETTDSDTDDDSCEHVYTTSTIVEPTCTDSGVRRYTCDLCGFTQDVTISALGHSYEVTETVETEYDGDDVTKVGYTLYTCSTCGATNKVYDTAVYPDYSGSGSSGGSGSSDDDDDDSSSSVWTTIKDTMIKRPL